MTNDNLIIESLISDYENMIHYIIKRNYYIHITNYPEIVSYDDLYQEGLIAIWKSSILYKENNEAQAKFSTYLYKSINTRITKYLIEVIGLPISSRNTTKRWELTNNKVSIDQIISFPDGNISNMYHYIPDCNISNEFKLSDYIDILNDIPKVLSKDELLILKLYSEGYTQVEIGTMLGLYQSQVSRIIKRSQLKLKNYAHIELIP